MCNTKLILKVYKILIVTTFSKEEIMPHRLEQMANLWPVWHMADQEGRRKQRSRLGRKYRAGNRMSRKSVKARGLKQHLGRVWG